MLEVLLWLALGHVLPALLLAAAVETGSVSDNQKLSTCRQHRELKARRHTTCHSSSDGLAGKSTLSNPTKG